jgi:hypothetical protein
VRRGCYPGLELRGPIGIITYPGFLSIPTKNGLAPLSVLDLLAHHLWATLFLFRIVDAFEDGLL